MMIADLAFFALAFFTIVAALVVVSHRNMFVASLYLAVALSLIAGFFVLLGADFLAAAQILLYVGGIIILIVFAIMMSSISQAIHEPQTNDQRLLSLVVSSGLVGLLVLGVSAFPFREKVGQLKATTLGLGQLLLGEMILPFEVVSLILVAALVGAILFTAPIAKGKK